MAFDDVILDIFDGDTKRIQVDADIVDQPDDLTGYRVFVYGKARFTDENRIVNWETPAATNIVVTDVPNGVFQIKFSPDVYAAISPVRLTTILYLTIGLITPGGDRVTLLSGKAVFRPGMN